jgi:hypothetical protein
LERENRELKEKLAELYPENVTKRPLKPADERGRFRLPLGNYLSRNKFWQEPLATSSSFPGWETFLAPVCLSNDGLLMKQTQKPV